MEELRSQDPKGYNLIKMIISQSSFAHNPSSNNYELTNSSSTYGARFITDFNLYYIIFLFNMI